jgi:hypothetical protein
MTSYLWDITLAVAFAVLLFAGAVRADGIETDEGLFTIPDGSTVTSFDIVPYLGSPQYGYQYEFGYAFADRTGNTEGNYWFGYIGVIDFSVPVSDLTLIWFANDQFTLTDNVGDSIGCGDCSGVSTLQDSGITQISWQVGGELGGIESMSYTLDATDPPSVSEPSSLLLSAMGLAALIGLKLKA